MLASFVVEILEDRFLRSVAKKTGNEYHPIGIMLLGHKQDVDRIEAAHRQDIERIMFEILILWRKNAPERRDPAKMVELLCDALKESRCGDVADYVEDESEYLKTDTAMFYYIRDCVKAV